MTDRTDAQSGLDAQSALDGTINTISPSSQVATTLQPLLDGALMVDEVSEPALSAASATKSQVWDGATSSWRDNDEFADTPLWVYTASTVMADPSAGNTRLNNVDISLATAGAFSKTTAQGADISTTLALLTVGSVVAAREFGAFQNRMDVVITSITDNGTWLEIGFSVEASSTLTVGVETALTVLSLKDENAFDRNYQVEILVPTPNTATPESDNADVNLATNWQSLHTLTTPVIEAGYYQLFTQCIFNISSTSRSAAFRMLVDGVSLGALLYESKDTSNDEVQTVTALPRELGLPNWDVDAAHTIELQSIIEQGGGATPTLTINNCYTTIERKA